MSEAIPILPMKEALKFWKKKTSISAKVYRGLQEEYRIRAFTVAKLAQIDQIDAVRKSIYRALKAALPISHKMGKCTLSTAHSGAHGGRQTASGVAAR